MEVVTHSNPFGAKSSNGTLPKAHPAKCYSATAAPLQHSNLALDIEYRVYLWPLVSGYWLLTSDFWIYHMPGVGRSKIRNFFSHWLPLIAYCLAIYIQSNYPGPERLPTFTFSDKILHFAAYGLLGILFFRAYATLSLKDRRNMLILLSIGSATLYGISDEIHQYFVPFRQADILDAVANASGSICAVTIFNYWQVKKKPA